MRRALSPVIALFAALPLLPGAAGSALAAQTCKYVDSEGRITFANVPVKNARQVMCFDPVPAPAPKRVNPAPRAPSAGADGSAKSRIDASTQRRRDEDRRRILEQELAEEQRLLDAARRLVSRERPAASGQAGESMSQVLENLGPAYEAAKRHERNIDAIRKELGTIR